MAQTQGRTKPIVPPAGSNRRGLLVAAAAFVAVLAIGVAAWLIGSGDEPDVVDPPPTTQVTTTLETAPTTAVPTTVPPISTTAAPATTTEPPEPTAVPFTGRIAMELDHQGLGGAAAIYVADSAVAELVFWDTLLSQEPDWSPDGESIVFSRTNGPGDVSGADLWLVNATTGEAAPIFEDEPHMRRPRFSPDGQFIAFVTVADNFRDPIDIGIVDVSGNLVMRIPIPATVAAWSPDGARLAYGLESEAGGGLWITDLEGNTEQILDTHDIATSLRWGEAGILTTVREAGAIGNHSVAIIDPEDGTIVELLDTEWTDPTWGPGGDVLVVQRSSGQLFGRNSTGEYYGPLVTGPQRVQEPAWTP